MRIKNYIYDNNKILKFAINYLLFFKMYSYLIENKIINKNNRINKPDFFSSYKKNKILFNKILRYVLNEYKISNDIYINKLVKITVNSFNQNITDYEHKNQIILDVNKIDSKYSKRLISDEDKKCILNNIFNYIDKNYIDYIDKNFNCYLIHHRYIKYFISLINQSNYKFNNISFIDSNMFKLFNKLKYMNFINLLELNFELNNKYIYDTDLYKDLYKKYILLERELSLLDNYNIYKNESFKKDFYNKHYFNKIIKYNVPYFSLNNENKDFFIQFQNKEYDNENNVLFSFLITNNESVKGLLIDLEKTIENIKNKYEICMDSINDVVEGLKYE